MRILIVRHGEPNYKIDSLTEKGWREAELLSNRLIKENIDYFYVSPLGRARDTASFTLKKCQKEATQLEWLREFDAHVDKPGISDNHRAWDWLPKEMVKYDELFDEHDWLNQENIKNSDTKEEYKWVVDNFDKLLEKHGYKRNKRLYKVVSPSHDTICLFCHFGLEMVLLSHLLNISPYPLWHGFCAAPTSVTTIYTEEREKDEVIFRIQSFGDVSHLYNNEPVSFAGRYDECYGDDSRWE